MRKLLSFPGGNLGEGQGSVGSLYAPTVLEFGQDIFTTSLFPFFGLGDEPEKKDVPSTKEASGNEFQSLALLFGFVVALAFVIKRVV